MRDFVWLLGPAGIVCGLVLALEVQLVAAAPLLTATSILTGLTFSMTTTLWSRNIDARRDPDIALHAEKLSMLDGMLNHLIEAVMAGMAATAALVVTIIFWGSDVPPLVSAIDAFLLIHLLCHVIALVPRFLKMAKLIR
ncbi:hypothetical protein [Nocardioides bruguierae]|uniref:Uncharacterized protein n=1 Tax=Nocardioides bruguierae TaxID=2945102 RepID=A0A9X2IEY9_9ACTN|nr:hypothetical protein [Nocardioides bruguierae]MCM0619824.1 hypothetical protein [Nocardioides bruguierae]